MKDPDTVSNADAAALLRNHLQAELSVVVPVHNEVESLSALAGEIATAMQCLARWECIWIDDGSTDGSRGLLQRLVRDDPHHRLLCFDGRRGQSAAMLSGFAASRFEFVGSLDADGQNDPADLPRLLAVCLQRSVALATGYRATRKDAWMRRLSSQIANTVRGLLVRDGIRDTGCSTRVGRRSALQSLPAFNGVHRFIPALIVLRGDRIAQVAVNHRGRRHGRSKYGVHNRLWRGLADIFGVRWLLARQIDIGTREYDPVASASEPSPGARNEFHSDPAAESDLGAGRGNEQSARNA